MTDYKTWLGIITLALGFASYIPYFIHIFQGKTKPHAFSWLIWAILTGIGFMAQFISGGGPGSWAMGMSAVVCLIIAIIAFKKGETKFTKFDWICLVGALLAILLWIITKNPLGSVILVSITDTIGFLPSFRKGYFKPYEETITTFAVSGLEKIISIFALTVLTPTTWLYPGVLTITNTLFVLVILIRRRQLNLLKSE